MIRNDRFRLRLKCAQVSAVHTPLSFSSPFLSINHKNCWNCCRGICYISKHCQHHPPYCTCYHTSASQSSHVNLFAPRLNILFIQSIICSGLLWSRSWMCPQLLPNSVKHSIHSVFRFSCEFLNVPSSQFCVLLYGRGFKNQWNTFRVALLGLRQLGYTLPLCW